MIAEEMKGEGIRIQVEPPGGNMDMQVKRHKVAAFRVFYLHLSSRDSTRIRFSVHFSLATNT